MRSNKKKKKILDLRIKGAIKKQFDYVSELAKISKRSRPKQLEMIIDEHMEWSSKIKNG